MEISVECLLSLNLLVVSLKRGVLKGKIREPQKANLQRILTENAPSMMASIKIFLKT